MHRGAAKILSDYLEASHRDPETTIGRLSDILDNQDLAEAIIADGLGG
jgi:hypothetical protein